MIEAGGNPPIEAVVRDVPESIQIEVRIFGNFQNFPIFYRFLSHFFSFFLKIKTIIFQSPGATPSTNAIAKSDVLIVTMSLLLPKSRGFIRLKKLSKRQDVDVYSNYLADPRDQATILTAIDHQMELLSSPALKQLGTTFLRPLLPECDTLPYPSKAYWKCYIKYLTSDGTHQMGTSKMGIDSQAVVNPRLKVYQINGLRQIDMGV